MKNVIYTFYNITLMEINKDKNNYYFYYDNKLYVFYLVENNIDVVEKIYKYLLENNVNSYKIILNKNNSLFTEVDNKKYSLLLVNGILKYEVKFEEFKYYPINEIPQDWGMLWSNRLDYYSLQLRELGYKYQTVLNSYGFFEGLAENAILYYNLSIEKFKEEKVVGIVHNRMYYPCYSFEYDNPLNFVIDYSIRDLSEYIKSYTMSSDFDIENVIILLTRLNVNKLMFNLLYSRLLYPTFYFDVFDKIILENGVDNDVVKVLEKLSNYLLVLREVYKTFGSKYELFNIEWLNKNVEI